MIKDFRPRLYQETILSTAANYNTLVVLPTGMGKTAVSLMLAVKQLSQYPASKILILAPTRPLIDQHRNTFRSLLNLEEEKFALFTGFVKPEKRQELWKTAQLIFSTPQGLENDIISNRISLEDVSLMVFDEAHRAVKDYSYVWIAKQYNKLAKHPKTLALTASPGSDMESITEVCKNLHIEEIEVRTDEDPDVRPYIQDVEIRWSKVELPEKFKEVKRFLEQCYRSKLEEVKEHGYISSIQLQHASKTDLLSIQAGLHADIAKGDKNYDILKSVSLIAEAMKVQHALELIETQDPSALHIYFEKLQAQSFTSKVQAVKNLVRDLNFRSAYIKNSRLVEEGAEHPKLARLKEIVKEEVNKDKNIKIIIFSQYRDVGSKINDEMSRIEGISSRLFIGQAKKNGNGMSQKKQIEVLDEFREDRFNTICMTSVGEEGLDIPSVDLVIFYEPIPSAIRTIQRRGRTGRNVKGRVIILMTKNTRDEGYKWSAHHKEKRMYRNLDTLKKNFRSGKIKKQITPALSSFIPKSSSLKVFADYREKGSGVIKELIDLGANIQLEKLDSADYLLSQRVAVEYKTTHDFVESIIDGRLLKQVKELKRNFERPVIMVEGEEDIYSLRNVHPNAIRGMLATISISYGIPIIYSRNFKDSAALLNIMARREQEESSSDYSLHGDRKPMTCRGQQEYIISSLPGVGPSLAKELLRNFRTIKNIMNSDQGSLRKVDKVGEKIANNIKNIIEKEYV